MSLRWRFALMFSGGAIVASVLAAGAAAVTTERVVNREVDRFLERRIEQIEALPIDDIVQQVRNEGPIYVPANRPNVLRRQGVSGLLALDSVFELQASDGQVLLAIEGAPELPDPPSVSARRFSTATVDNTIFRILTVRVAGDSTFQIARDVTEEQAVLATLRSRIIRVGLAVAALAGLGGWLLARRVVKPVEYLTEATEQVARTGELSEPIETNATGEVGRLADSFNTMLAALGESREQQRRLVQDASHELRTPLTSLRTNIEVLQRADSLSPDEQSRLLADVDFELTELTTLASELVDLATQTDTSRDTPSQTTLYAIAERVAERSRRRIANQIVVTGSGSVVTVQEAEVERAIANLVENAAKWSPADTAIEVTIVGGTLRVRDHGAGIAPDDLSRVFDRFYRATDARSKPGSGLGLAIVSQVAERHGGTVHASNAADGGAIVGFDIPTS